MLLILAIEAALGKCYDVTVVLPDPFRRRGTLQRPNSLAQKWKK